MSYVDKPLYSTDIFSNPENNVQFVCWVDYLPLLGYEYNSHIAEAIPWGISIFFSDDR